MDFRSVGCVNSVFSCMLLAIAYVSSLYLWRSKLPRNHSTTVKKRFCSVLFVSLFAPAYVWLWADNISHGPSLWSWLGIRLPCLLNASVIPLALVMILFFGPIVMYFFEDITSYFSTSYWKEEFNGFIWLRNYIVAPFTEEFVFRACMLPLLVPCLGFTKVIFVCPLFFGVAHVHHVIERLRFHQESAKEVWIQTVFQFTYTTIFGAFSAFLFLRTGHLTAPVICHSFCNVMGFPAFSMITSYSQPKSVIICLAFILGLICFMFLLFPLTEPSLFCNDVYIEFF